MSDRGGPTSDQTLAPLQVMTQEQYDGLRELAPRYEEAGVSIAEIDAQRAKVSALEQQVDLEVTHCRTTAGIITQALEAERAARATAETYLRENAREAEKAWTRAHELEQERDDARDPKMSAGARHERAAFKSYLKRILRYQDAPALADALQWVQRRQVKYDCCCEERDDALRASVRDHNRTVSRN